MGLRNPSWLDQNFSVSHLFFTLSIVLICCLAAFNQTERGKQQGGKGTGLGLALVRNIVKLSGGRLGVKSQSNKGSTFWVELPLGVGRKALIPSPGINIVSRVDSQGSGSDGSMGSDVAKVRAAAALRESQNIGNGMVGNKECHSGDSCPVQLHLRTNNSLAKVVDAAALKASDMSSVMRSSDLMHSTIMEQSTFSRGSCVSIPFTPLFQRWPS